MLVFALLHVEDVCAALAFLLHLRVHIVKQDFLYALEFLFWNLLVKDGTDKGFRIEAENRILHVLAVVAEVCVA